MHTDETPITQQMIDELVPWLEMISEPDFDAGHIAGGQTLTQEDIDAYQQHMIKLGLHEEGDGLGRLKPGMIQMPYAALSDGSMRLIDHLQTSGWMVGFDWTDWAHDRGAYLMGDSLDQHRLGEATLEELRMLITALVRQDRFVEGLMLDMLQEGAIRLILEQIQQRSPQ